MTAASVTAATATVSGQTATGECKELTCCFEAALCVAARPAFTLCRMLPHQAAGWQWGSVHRTWWMLFAQR